MMTIGCLETKAIPLAIIGIDLLGLTIKIEEKDKKYEFFRLLV